MDNRIVRSSTRLGKFEGGEKSPWYEGRILTFAEVTGGNIDVLSQTVAKNGETYIKTPFGYVNEKYKEDQDTIRGLYPLSIPNILIFKVQFPELLHIYNHRNKYTTAHPELHELMDLLKEDVERALPSLGEKIGKIYSKEERKYIDEHDKIVISKALYNQLNRN